MASHLSGPGMTRGPVLGDCRTDGWLTRTFSDDSGSESRSDTVIDEFRVIVEVSTPCKLSLLTLLFLLQMRKMFHQHVKQQLASEWLRKHIIYAMLRVH